VSAASAALKAQPLWSLVPLSARARYIRRAAVATLDELDDLSAHLAGETGRPREHIVESELLPAVRGLRALADDGPRALADRRAGRRTRIVQAPVGVIGLRGPSASPWAEPALETAAALLAGNGVLIGVAAPRLRVVFLRAGVPGELVAMSEDFDGARVIDLPRPDRRETLLVLGGAPLNKVVEAAVGADRRVVTVAGAVPGLVEMLSGVVEAPDTESAIALTAREARDAPVSIWARDDAQAERIARRLPSPTTWISHHGSAPTPVDVRLARHVAPRRLESRAAWARELPVDAQTAIAELRYGRESRRWPALRALVRSARRER
jgi:Aldehyde dehydrogenase family